MQLGISWCAHTTGSPGSPLRVLSNALDTGCVWTTIAAGCNLCPRRHRSSRPSSTSRPRLTVRLSEGLTRPLTLVSAPAGYGKTTLLSEWHAGLGRDFPVAWLFLDAGDNDPARFLNYLTAALDTLKTGLGDGSDLPLSRLCDGRADTHAGRLAAGLVAGEHEGVSVSLWGHTFTRPVS
jgi:hypothetical protein